MELLKNKLNIRKSELSKPFILLASGRFVSQLGDKLYLLALPWLVLDLTHSALHSSITLALEILPQIILAPFIGVIVDRKPRKLVMVNADFIRAAIIGLITILAIIDRIEMLHIYIAAFLLSTFTLLFDSASEGYLPTIVRKDRLVDANASLTTINTLMRLIGPLLSGILIGLVGAAWTIGINAISFLISGIILLFLPNYKLEGIKPKKLENILFEIKEGFQFLLKHETLFPIALFSTFMNVGIFMTTSLLIFQSKETLGFTSEQTSIIFWISGITATLTTFLVKILKNYVDKGQIIRYGSFTVFLAVLLLVYNQSLIAITISYSLILMVGIMVNVNMMAYRQEVIPSQLFGRVMTSTRVLSNIFVPISILLAGYLAMKYSARLVFEISAIIIFLNVLYAWFSNIKYIK